jgi:dethiobiotin synthetase
MSVLKGKFFITGTDTEVGKTWVGCRLLEAAENAGLDCYGLKPVAAGCEETDEGLRNDDALALLASASVKLSYDLVNPMALRAAMAPHLAAKLEGRTLRASALKGYLNGAMMTRRADLILVEGAGGWRVPLNDAEMLSDLAISLGLPVILVVGMRLGCINHALLTAEAIVRDGCQLAGWVANDLGDPMPSLAENIATLEKLMPVPRIIV